MWSPVDGQYFFDSDVLNQINAQNNYGVISGMTVTQTGAGANQAVDVAAGVYLVAGTRVTYAGGNIAAPAADATNPRKDILVADNAGALTFTQGTAASALPAGETGPRTYQPVPPNIPASRIILAEIWRAANDNTIANADITEKFIVVPSRMIGREVLTAQGQIIYASAAQTPAALAPGTSGYYLQTLGAGANPQWAIIPGTTYNEYTVGGVNWTKPAGANLVFVECVGGGGGGGGGTTGGASGGSGGGGGAITRAVFKAAALGATEAITIGAGGTGGASDAVGTAGGATNFGTKIYAYGGGAGTAAVNAGGAGGGGTGGVGANGGAAGVGNSGGAPTIQGSTDGNSLGGRGGGGGGSASAAITGGNAEFGGGGGGSAGNATTGAAGAAGGGSIFGAGGGGGGGYVTNPNGGAGGAFNSYAFGGGGTAGVGAAGGAGSSRSYGCGDGGGGGAYNADIGYNGGAGGAPGGAGGGGGSGVNGGGVGGAGAAGIIRVWS